MIVLYTAAIGPRSKIGDLPFKPKQVSAVSFSFPLQSAKHWDSRTAVVNDCDLRRVARYYKANPHKLFPEADWWIWYDASLTPAYEPLDLLESLESEGIELCAFSHPRRTCAYEEAATAAGRREEVRLPRDHPAILAQQVQSYAKEKFPTDYGLWENGFLIRKNTQKVRAFNDLWWKEICVGSREDQVSMPYAVWKIPGLTTSMLGPEKIHDSKYIVDTGHAGLPWEQYFL